MSTNKKMRRKKACAKRKKLLVEMTWAQFFDLKEKAELYTHGNVNRLARYLLSMKPREEDLE